MTLTERDIALNVARIAARDIAAAVVGVNLKYNCVGVDVKTPEVVKVVVGTREFCLDFEMLLET